MGRQPLGPAGKNKTINVRATEADLEAFTTARGNLPMSQWALAALRRAADPNDPRDVPITAQPAPVATVAPDMPSVHAVGGRADPTAIIDVQPPRHLHQRGPATMERNVAGRKQSRYACADPTCGWVSAWQ